MAADLFDAKTARVSVVMATLGGATVADTIRALNSGSLVPAEILICIPTQEADRVRDLGFDNVSVVVTEVRGQVPQRAIGFAHAANDFVLQIDDDMLVDQDCVERLLRTLHTWGSKVAVAPAFYATTSGESVYESANSGSPGQTIYHWIMNGSEGFQPGRVDRSGSGQGIDPRRAGSDPFEVEWIPGGCALHRRENLVLKNFFPFPGKAYYEDLFHSFELRRTGVRLLLDPSARCWMVPVPSTTFAVRDFFRHLKNDYRAKTHYVRLAGRSLTRMHAWYLIYTTSFLLKKLFTKASSG